MRKAGQQEAALFLGAAAYRQDPYARRDCGGQRACHRGQAEARCDELELGQPVAGGVDDLGALVQPRPHAHQPVLAGGGARDPAPAAQVGHVDVVAAGQRMRGGHRQVQRALGECAQHQRWGFRVGWAERRRRRQQGQVEAAGTEGAHQRRGAALPTDDVQVRVGAAQGGQGAGQQDRSRAGEPAQADGRGLRRQTGQFARGRVDLVEYDRRPAHDDPAGRGQPYAVAAPFQ